MKYFASFIVCSSLMLLISLSILLVISIKKNDKTSHIKDVVLISLCVIIVFVSMIIYGKFIWPFDRQINLELYEVLTVEGDQVLDYPGQAFWHSAYEQFGLYAGSFHFNTEDPIEFYDWPPMHFDNSSYIISYGQRIVSLSYNVWDTIDNPVRTGAYTGYAIMEDIFVPNEVYIYRIPKIRIDNGSPGKSVPVSTNGFSTSTFLLVIFSLATLILIELFFVVSISQKRRGTGGRFCCPLNPQSKTPFN